jgi:hypothetical protein
MGSWGREQTIHPFLATRFVPPFVQSQAPAGPTDRRVLNVMALDDKGQPVLGLGCSDFKIFDDDPPQRIADFYPHVYSECEDTSTLVVRALQLLETCDSIYVYLLTNHGDLYNVHDLCKEPASESGGDWRRNHAVAETEPYLSATFRLLLATHSSVGLLGKRGELGAKFKLCWCDALMVAALAEGECCVLYSENLGQRFGFLRVANSFL